MWFKRTFRTKTVGLGLSQSDLLKMNPAQNESVLQLDGHPALVTLFSRRPKKREETYR